MLHCLALATPKQPNWAAATVVRHHKKLPSTVCRFSVAHPDHHLKNRDAPRSMEAQVLAMAERDLADYCSVTDFDPQCWNVHDWFMSKVQDLEAALALGQGSKTSDDYHRLQQTLRELAAGSGSMEQMYNALKIMKRLEDKHAQSFKSAAPHPTEASKSVKQPTLLPTTLNTETTALLTELFNKADLDGNGRLTWSEFNKALHWIGDDLSEEDQEMVSSALDLQGSVSLDQFIAIVEQAELARSQAGTDARFLRHLTHRHPSQIDEMLYNL